MTIPDINTLFNDMKKLVNRNNELIDDSVKSAEFKSEYGDTTSNEYLYLFYAVEKYVNALETAERTLYNTGIK
jgi:t-SNARE complex subunit (syntaxin)